MATSADCDSSRATTSIPSAATSPPNTHGRAIELRTASAVPVTATSRSSATHGSVAALGRVERRQPPATRHQHRRHQHRRSVHLEPHLRLDARIDTTQRLLSGHEIGPITRFEPDVRLDRRIDTLCPADVGFTPLVAVVAHSDHGVGGDLADAHLRGPERQVVDDARWRCRRPRHGRSCDLARCQVRSRARAGHRFVVRQRQVLGSDRGPFVRYGSATRRQGNDHDPGTPSHDVDHNRRSPLALASAHPRSVARTRR